jgi:hypothetical protein
LGYHGIAWENLGVKANSRLNGEYSRRHQGLSSQWIPVSFLMSSCIPRRAASRQPN